MMMVIVLLSLALTGNSGVPLEKPRAPNSCELESVNRGVMAANDFVASDFAIDDSSLFVGIGKSKTQYVPYSWPIVSAVYDSVSKRIFWISFNQVCEINTKTNKSRAIFGESGLSSIGQIWLSNNSLMMRSASNDSCVKFDFHKERVIQKLVRCKSPM